ncbi:hypothetical protein BJ684DRAFT_19682 [Piptocephalis cylindrospora]|uniref:Uncharacterized protein n=1 Tax=Piptocephalis cylindrospora TaxID=1907219 RepID=A0A4P9Y583_9FUNG|nr:hypothetical protein BJ684DRAFT_19682 [Piptocephalis cylindrospora]|eukprot:RKP13862.1 hypothetical protein BJ684DRAFT_19682 [Piptocephalis cylindrospora]
MTTDIGTPHPPMQASSPFAPVETRLRLLERQILAKPQGRMAELAAQTTQALESHREAEEQERMEKERMAASASLSEDGEEGRGSPLAPPPIVAPSTIPDSSPSRPKVMEELPLIQQVQALQLKAQQHMHQRQVLVNFWKKYEVHQSMLEADDLSLAKERLDVSAKLEILLAAEEDISQVLAHLQTCADLQDHVNPKAFQDVEEHIPVLTEVISNHENQVKQSMALTRQITSILGAYNNQVNAFSELFLHWDSVIKAVEARVSLLEKKV